MLIPVWLNKLTDNRSIWDWIKYNVRVHAIKYSKERAKERKEKGNVHENNYSQAKPTFEVDTSDINTDLLKFSKDELELFYEENEVNYFPGPSAMARTWREPARNIFLT